MIKLGTVNIQFNKIYQSFFILLVLIIGIFLDQWEVKYF